MERPVCKMNDRLNQKEHKRDFQGRAEGRISRRTIHVVLHPVAHPDGSQNGVNRKHRKRKTVGFSRQSHCMKDRRMQRQNNQAHAQDDHLTAVHKAPASGIGFFVVSGAHLLADKDRCRRGKACKEADDQSLQCTKDRSRRNRLLRLMSEDNVDQHIADANQHLVQDNREAFLQKFLQKCRIPFPVSGNIKKIRDMLDLRRHHDDKHINNRRKDGSDSRSADSHSGESKLSEDQDIVADAVRNHRSNCSGKRNFHTLHRTQKR